MPHPITTADTPVSALYIEHSSWLRSWLAARLNCEYQAQDLSQDAFVRILNNPNSRQQVANLQSPRGYLAKIAGNLLIDFFRRQSLEKAYLETLMAECEDVCISEEERHLILEALYELDHMLSGLGHNVKTAFLLSQLQGLPYRDIALQLGVSISSVKKYMAKATEHCLLYELGFHSLYANT